MGYKLGGVNAKGDILVSDGVGNLNQLPVGADGQALIADAVSAAGVKWGKVGYTADISLLYLYTAENKGNRLNMVGGIMDPFANASDVAVTTNMSLIAGSYNVISTGMLPAMTSNTAPAPLVASVSDPAQASTAWAMFNGTMGSSMAAISGSYGQFNIDMGVAKQVFSYSLSTQYGNPKNWTFQGSTNGATWVTLDTQTNQTSWTTGQYKHFVLAIPQTYRHYRLFVTANNGYGYTILTQFIFNYNYTYPTTLISNSFTASAVPTTCRLGVQATGALTINTDLIGYVSRDGGTTWATATLVLIDTLADGTKYYEDAAVSVAAQPSGTAMQYKIVTANANWTSTDGVLLQWS